MHYKPKETNEPFTIWVRRREGKVVIVLEETCMLLYS